MTINDRKMDRALAGLSMQTPQCSAWPAIDACLQRANGRARKQKYFKYSAAAASVMVVVAGLNNWQTAHEGIDELQKIVDNAVRDARPSLMFSSHQYSADSSALDALLVTAKPRDDVKGKFLSDGGRKTDEIKNPSQGVTNEF